MIEIYYIVKSQYFCVGGNVRKLIQSSTIKVGINPSYWDEIVFQQLAHCDDACWTSSNYCGFEIHQYYIVFNKCLIKCGLSIKICHFLIIRNFYYDTKLFNQLYSYIYAYNYQLIKKQQLTEENIEYPRTVFIVPNILFNRKDTTLIQLLVLICACFTLGIVVFKTVGLHGKQNDLSFEQASLIEEQAYLEQQIKILQNSLSSPSFLEVNRKQPKSNLHTHNQVISGQNK